MLSDENASVDLPVRIVVLTIIGTIGIYVILSAIMNAPFVPGPMFASPDRSSFNISGTVSDSPDMVLYVMDNEGIPVGGASVVVWCPGREKAVAGVTDPNGEFQYRLLDISLPAGKKEGFLSVKVMHADHLDHHNDHFVKVRHV